MGEVEGSGEAVGAVNAGLEEVETRMGWGGGVVVYLCDCSVSAMYVGRE